MYRFSNVALWAVRGGIFLALSLVVVAAPIAAQTARCNTNIDFVTTGAEAFDAGDYSDAVTAYTCALQSDPFNPDLLLARGSANILNETFAQGLLDYGFAGGYTNVYNAALEAEIERLNAALEADDEDVEALTLRAALLYRIFEHEAALLDLNRLLEIDPDNLFALLFRATTLRYLNFFEESETDFARALELGSDDADIYTVIADPSYYRADMSQAMQDVTLALLIDPDFLPALDIRAAINEYQYEYEAARADLERIIEESDTVHPEYLTRLGSVLLGLGERETADATFREALVTIPGNDGLIYNTAYAYTNIDPALSARYFLAYIEIHATSEGAETTITIGDAQTLEMTEGLVYRLPFPASEGEILTITVPEGETLDPIIVLLDSQGTPIVANDDVTSTDYSAVIDSFVVPADDTYTLIVSHAGAGSEGTTTLSILDTSEPDIASIEPVQSFDLYESEITSEIDADFVAEWMRALYDRVQIEALSAPAGSRVYGYAGITVYEAVVVGMPDNRSLSGQLNGLSSLPYPDESLEVDWATVANQAMRIVFTGLMLEKGVDNADAFNEVFERQLEERSAEHDEAVIDASLAYGEEVGKALLDWIALDNYAEIREMTYEMPTGQTGGYTLTAEGTQPAEPFWGELRPFMMSYTSQCDLPMGLEYSTETDSTFYLQALEVMNVGDNLTDEQRDIAQWWVDTPGITGTPSGHWIEIENQLVEQLDLNLNDAAEMYGMMGMTIADTFIAAWRQKYEINILRPVTYIQENLNRRWLPFIQSPPFPEYPSGHSVTSGAAAEMLTFLFGNQAFIDRTGSARDLGERSYTSFYQAASEAAISRMYGGIHYRTAIENGLRMGECITETALNNIIMRPVSQGGE